MRTTATGEQGIYLFSKYTLRNERYTFGGDTLIQGDRAYGLTDPFEIIESVTDPTTGGKVLHRAWDVYEGHDGQRFTVETYNEDAKDIEESRQPLPAPAVVPMHPGLDEDGIPNHLWSAHCEEGCCL